MRPHIFIAFSFLILLSSCNKEKQQQRLVDTEKAAKRRELIFQNLNKGWNFNSHPENNSAQKLTNSWQEWRLLLREMAQKPQKSIGAFQQKAKTLSKKVNEMGLNVPAAYNTPAVRSRISTLATKINMLDLYINLKQIPDEKVIQLVQEVNVELASLQRQLDEIDRKKAIPKEEGETDFLMMKDTTRAIPTTPAVQP